MSFQNKNKKATSTTEKPLHSKDRSESQDESAESENSDEEDEEREEEEDEDEDDEDEEEDNENDEEEEEENDEEDEELSESEDDDKGVVSIQAHAASFEDVEKVCVSGEKTPDIHVNDNGERRAGVSGDANSVDELKSRTQQIAGESYATPVTFDAEHDYVFSAVRVESKLSDEEESLAKEIPWSAERNQVSHRNVIGKLSKFTASSEVEEDDISGETEMDNGSPRSKNQIRVWTDSIDEEDSQTVGVGPNAALADQTEEHGVENNGSSDGKDDAGSHKWTHRSTQGSLLGRRSPGAPQYEKTAAEATNDDSYWDPPCKTNDQNVHLPFVKNAEASVVTRKNPGERRHLLDCCEEASLISMGRVAEDPSSSLSPVPMKEDGTKKQIGRNLDVDSHGRLTRNKRTDLGNDQIDEGHLVDEDDSCRSAAKGHVQDSSYTSAYSKATGLEEAAAVEVDGGSSEDCDHTPQELQDNLGRTAVKEFDVGDGSDNAHNRCPSAGNPLAGGSRLNSRIHLESGSAAFGRTEMSPGDLGGQPTPDDVTAVENCDSRRNCADELLLQTDIDDVDLDSPDEAKSVVERSEEVRNSEGPIKQVKEENARYF